MHIHKIGHCCLLIKIGKTSILTDPGLFSSGWQEIKDLDAILVTHEHADHCHIEGIRKLLEHNPTVPIFVNRAVANIFDEQAIPYVLVSDQEEFEINGIRIQAFEYDHEEIYPTLDVVLNTGFLIQGSLYYGGDALQAPPTNIKYLALPVAGPWMRIAQAIEFCLHVKPNIAFSVHDGILVQQLGGSHKAPGKIFSQHNIEWHALSAGDELHLQ